MFKGKYFFKGIFFGFFFGPNVSYFWREFVECKNFFYGKSIKVWYNRWLVDENGMLVIFFIFFGMEDFRVADFIDDTGEWRFNLLEEFFNERDRNLIFLILISRRDIVDD